MLLSLGVPMLLFKPSYLLSPSSPYRFVIHYCAPTLYLPFCIHALPSHSTTTHTHTKTFFISPLCACPFYLATHFFPYISLTPSSHCVRTCMFLTAYPQACLPYFTCAVTHTHYHTACHPPPWHARQRCVCASRTCVGLPAFPARAPFWLSAHCCAPLRTRVCGLVYVGARRLRAVHRVAFLVYPFALDTRVLLLPLPLRCVRLMTAWRDAEHGFTAVRALRPSAIARSAFLATRRTGFMTIPATTGSHYRAPPRFTHHYPAA